MIVTRTPLRLPIGGGGTDLPSYYEQYGGFWISAAFNRYVNVIVNRRFDKQIRVSYSKTEIVRSPEEIQHPVVREALQMLEIQEGIEIVSVADLPANTGLGSSGSFTVGLLLALHTFKKERVNALDVAEEAFEIEVGRLGEPIGKQDQYIAAFGGVTCFEADRNGRVTVTPLRISSDVVADLESSLLLFYTGIQRSAPEVLEGQSRAVAEKEKVVTDSMHNIKDIAVKIKDGLESGDVNRLGELMHEHWTSKRRLSTKVTTSEIDRWYDLARASGALGGKVIGAGGGGFLMFYCDGRESKRRVREALEKEKLVPMRFTFDNEGSKVVSNF